MKVASFDIGSKNFAFCIQEVDEISIGTITPPKQRYKNDGTPTDEYKHTLEQVYKNGNILLYMNIDLTEGIPKSTQKSYLDPQVFRNMIERLDRYKMYFQEVDTVLVEQQMAFRTQINVKALKIGQACFTYFLMRFPSIEVIEFKSFYKTQVLGAPKKLTKPQRKKWAVEECKYILELRKDDENLEIVKCSKKKDDISDVVVQTCAFLILRFIDNKI